MSQLENISDASLALLSDVLKGVLVLEQGEAKKTFAAIKKGVRKAEAQNLISRGTEEIIRKKISSLLRGEEEVMENKIIRRENGDIEIFWKEPRVAHEIHYLHTIVFPSEIFSDLDGSYKDRVVELFCTPDVIHQLDNPCAEDDEDLREWHSEEWDFQTWSVDRNKSRELWEKFIDETVSPYSGPIIIRATAIVRRHSGHFFVTGNIETYCNFEFIIPCEDYPKKMGKWRFTDIDWSLGKNSPSEFSCEISKAESAAS